MEYEYPWYSEALGCVVYVGIMYFGVRALDALSSYMTRRD